MLMKAAAAVKADKAKALDMFNKGEGGFLDRDLYVFCNNLSDGKSVAIGNPNAKQLLGTDTRTLKDATGKDFGAELYRRIPEADRRDHRSHLHVSEARCGQDARAEGEPRDQGQR